MENNKRLDFDTILTLQSLPYNPGHKDLGLKINKAYDTIKGFFHLGYSTIVALTDDEIQCLKSHLGKGLEGEVTTIHDAGEIQHAIDQLTK